MDDVLLVFCHAPDASTARLIATLLLESRLAACVNIGPRCDSIYRWQGAVEEAVEFPLVIKTTRSRYAQVEALIRAKHPYEVPEIIAIPVERGLPAYLAWVAAQTAA